MTSLMYAFGSRERRLASRVLPSTGLPPGAIVALAFFGASCLPEYRFNPADGAPIIDGDAPLPDAADTGVDTGADVIRIDPTIPAPRPRAPLSTSTVSHRRPTLRWLLHIETDGAEVELCRNRDMSQDCRPTESAMGDHWRPTSELDSGWWFWRLRGRKLGSTGTNTSPVWQFYVGPRSATGDRDTSYGTTLDLNGDGFADVAIGSPGADNRRGRVDVYYGSAMGLAAEPVSLYGTETGDRFGSAVSAAGDVDGDGFADLLVGAPGATVTIMGMAMANAGSALVFHGSEAGIQLGARSAIQGRQPNDWFGSVLTTAGDVNGDGFADVVIGAPNAFRMTSEEVGRVAIYHGGLGGISTEPARTLAGSMTREKFGSAIDGAGDVNGDGFSDILIGASGHSMNLGSVSLYLGSRDGIANAVTLSLRGMTMGEKFGHAVSWINDLNGDGLSDFVVGSPDWTFSGGARYEGIVRVYLGRTDIMDSVSVETSLDLRSDNRVRSFGEALADAGDLNGDGFHDLIVGAPSSSDSSMSVAQAGVTAIYLGSQITVAPMPSRIFEGSAAGARFGETLSGAGDTNRDGYSDFIIGAPGVSAPPNGMVGTADFYFGAASPAGFMRRSQYRGRMLNEQLGAAVASALAPNTLWCLHDPARCVEGRHRPFGVHAWLFDQTSRWHPRALLQ